MNSQAVYILDFCFRTILSAKRMFLSNVNIIFGTPNNVSKATKQCFFVEIMLPLMQKKRISIKWLDNMFPSPRERVLPSIKSNASMIGQYFSMTAWQGCFHRWKIMLLFKLAMKKCIYQNSYFIFITSQFKIMFPCTVMQLPKKYLFLGNKSKSRVVIRKQIRRN